AAAGLNYVEDYLDSIESMPFDLQRNVSLMREIDAKYQGGGREVGCAVHKGGPSLAVGLRWKGFGVRKKVLGG
uniref:Inhibitor of growth protein N-terminal histone-binding domain-containing protein n=1 Tax=Cyanistes caeruleus TaxID=156563 RepID=A0A8C0Z949_CYACU